MRPTSHPLRPLVAIALALALLLSGCGGGDPATGESASPSAAGPTTLTDHAGREVSIDAPAEKVFGAGPPATTMLYTFAPDLLAGWNSETTDAMAEYIPQQYLDLPVLGRGFGNEGTINPEVLLEEGVDLIIDAGEISDRYTESADELQEQTGIPVLMLSTDFDQLADGYDLLGRATGQQDRADELAGEVGRILDLVAAGAANVTEDAAVGVYYAAGDEGLTTGREDSIHTRIIPAVGARNVAGTEVESQSGRVDVGAEQVLAWDPDVVILAPDSDSSPLASDPASSPTIGTLSAIQDGDYLLVPAAPYSWFDQPPSVNQLLGALWVAESLHPDAYDIDLPAEVVSYYRTFYSVELTSEDADLILKEANTPR